MALGASYLIVINNAISRVVDKDCLSMVFSVSGVLDTVGSMITSPMLGGAYLVGLDKGGGWIGLPFWVASVLYVVALLSVFVALLHKSKVVNT